MRRQPLITQILTVNALLIAAATMTGIVAARLSLQDRIGTDEELLLGAAILATILVNGLLLRRRMAGLEHLTAAMGNVDLARPGRRVTIDTARESPEIARLAEAFNMMLDRLEAERRRTSAAVIAGQEAERARLARDLHDECNQALTAVLLHLQVVGDEAPPQLAAELAKIKAMTVDAMDELLRLARELRPTALDDHGLTVALRTQLERVGAAAGINTALNTYDQTLEQLTSDQQTVVYRIVQEALSNAIQHGGARNITVNVSDEAGEVRVTVTDDGHGIPRGGASSGGHGLVGMRERARLVGGRTTIGRTIAGGTEVELVLPTNTTDRKIE